MTSLLLVIIYVAFISLGLPDSILGSAWPSMYKELHVSISYAGIISMIIAGGTIISSLCSDKLIRRFGTAMVTTISVGMTAVALLGFSTSTSFWQLCLWGIPYGLGAGSVDVALNNFVALNYTSRHMSWLHCFWGVGATTGPYIMGLCLANGLSWNTGYGSIGIIQMLLVICLFFTLPLWKKKGKELGVEKKQTKPLSIRETLGLPGAKEILVGFFCYCSLESTAGLWASSYLVLFRGIHAETAASWAALFYLGITAGRFLGGFVTGRVGDRNMVRIGQVVAGLGVIILVSPFGNLTALLGLILIGLGCAPIYPSLLHATPLNFGEEHSQSIMGLQMGCAYIGTTLMAPLFGVIAQHISIRVYPYYMVFFLIVMVIMVEKVNCSFKKGSSISLE